MNRDELLKKLTVLDFMAVDIGLYLDTHPTDYEAIAEYNRVVREASELRYQYEMQVGPLYSFRSSSNRKMFNWIEPPWPWSKESNFDFSERGRY